MRKVARKHAQQQAWIKEQRRDHAAAALLQLRLTRRSAATPQAEARDWLEALALGYACFVPFGPYSDREDDCDTARPFVVVPWGTCITSRNPAVVCGRFADSSVRIERRLAHAGFQHTEIHGLSELFEGAFVRATMRNGSTQIGVLRQHAWLQPDANDVTFVETPADGASLQYYDAANQQRHGSLRSVTRLQQLRQTWTVTCRDGYNISLHIGVGSASSTRGPEMLGPFECVETYHYPRGSPRGFHSQDDAAVYQILTAAGLRRLVQSHGGLLFGRLPAMIAWKSKTVFVL